MGVSGLGSLLVREGLLTETDRKTIAGTCGQSSWAFAKTILAMGLLDEDELAAFFADHTQYSVAERDFIDQIDNAVLDQIDARMIARLEMLPMRSSGQGAQVAVVDPLDRGTIRQLEFFTGLEIEPVIAPISQIYEGLAYLTDEFKPHRTNLQNFLKNHAATSWQRQKIAEGVDHFVVAGASQANQSAGDDGAVKNLAASESAAAAPNDGSLDGLPDEDFSFDDHHDDLEDLDTDPFHDALESDVSIEGDDASTDAGELDDLAGFDGADDLADFADDDFAEDGVKSQPDAGQNTKPAAFEDSVFADSHVDDDDPFTASGDVFDQEPEDIHERPAAAVEKSQPKKIAQSQAEQDELAAFGLDGDDLEDESSPVDAAADELAAFGLDDDDLEDESDLSQTTTADLEDKSSPADAAADELAAFGLEDDDLEDDSSPDHAIADDLEDESSPVDAAADELAAFSRDDDNLEEEGSPVEEAADDLAAFDLADDDLDDDSSDQALADLTATDDSLLDDDLEAKLESDELTAGGAHPDVAAAALPVEAADELPMIDAEEFNSTDADAIGIDDEFDDIDFDAEPAIETLEPASLKGSEPAVDGSDPATKADVATRDLAASSESNQNSTDDPEEDDTPFVTQISPLSASPEADDRWQDDVNEFDSSDLPETIASPRGHEMPAITSQPRTLNVGITTKAINKGLVKISLATSADKALQIACDHLKEVFTHGAIITEKSGDQPLVYAWHHGKTLVWNPALGAALADIKNNEKWQLADMLFPTASEDPATKSYRICLKHPKFAIELRFSGWIREELSCRPLETVKSLLQALLKKSVV